MSNQQNSTNEHLRKLIDNIRKGVIEFPDIKRAIQDEHIEFEAPNHEWWGIDMFPEDPMDVKYKVIGMDPGGVSESVPDLQEVEKLFRETILATVASYENYCTSQAVSDENNKPLTYESIMEALKLLPKHKSYIFVTHKDDWDDLMQLFAKGEYIVVPNVPRDIKPEHEYDIVANTTRFKAVLWNDEFGIGLENDFWELTGGVPGKILAIDEQAIRPPLGWRK